MNKLIIIFITLISFNILASEFEIADESKYIPDFTNRFSALIGVNPDMTKTNENETLHLSYGLHKIENAWWDFNFTYSKGHFDKLTTNNPTATLLSSNQMAYSTTTSQMAFGAGLQYETHYIQTLMPFKDMYELIGASLTYNFLKDPQVSNTFSGPGMIAKYSVLKKLTNYISIGGNLIYNLAVVKRSQLNSTETSSSRSLTLSHLTLGFDFSFYL